MSRIEELEKRLAADPNSRIFVQLAEEYRKQGLLENAIEVCETGLTKHPQYPSARVALGRALLEAETFDRASEEFEAVLAQVPDNILANKFLGETYHRLGRYDEAIQKYGIAQTLAPEDTELEGKIDAVKAEMAGGGPPPPPAPPDPSDATAQAGHAPPVPVAADSPLEPTLVDAQASVPVPGQAPPPVPVTAPPPPVPPATPEPAAGDVPPVPTEEPPASPQEELAPIPLVAVDEPMVLESAAESFARAGQAQAEDAVVEPVPVLPESEPPPMEPPPVEPAAMEPPPMEPPPVEPPPVVEAAPEPPGFEPPPFEPAPPEPPAMETIPEPPPLQPDSPSFEPPPMVEAPPLEPPTIEATPVVEPLPVEPAPLEPSPEPLAAEPERGEGIETPTMAELYASQGHFDKALAVYRNLLARDPNETQYLERIEELEMLAKATSDSAPAAPVASAEPPGDGASDSERQKTIEVLEQWLDGIRRSRRA